QTHTNLVSQHDYFSSVLICCEPGIRPGRATSNRKDDGQTSSEPALVSRKWSSPLSTLRKIQRRGTLNSTAAASGASSSTPEQVAHVLTAAGWFNRSTSVSLVWIVISRIRRTFTVVPLGCQSQSLGPESLAQLPRSMRKCGFECLEPR